ncbi:hypothetical protein DFH09DRAFT_1102679 [Mycena vulgaris]|nr:hypothetical protein DFH09DRAFT_1102679 [Mycena vulgaris]
MWFGNVSAYIFRVDPLGGFGTNHSLSTVLTTYQTLEIQNQAASGPTFQDNTLNTAKARHRTSVAGRPIFIIMNQPKAQKWAVAPLPEDCVEFGTKKRSLHKLEKFGAGVQRLLLSLHDVTGVKECGGICALQRKAGAVPLQDVAIDRAAKWGNNAVWAGMFCVLPVAQGPGAWTMLRIFF